MEKLVIDGGAPLSGTVTPAGNKNGALPILAASVLTSEGVGLEATVARVKLPEFRGYVLFDWVHPGLNVPAAYRDLKALKR